MKRLLLILLSFNFTLCGMTQIFEWGNDGYIDFSGGGVFYNIDSSSINLEISGLINDYTSNQTPTVVHTGINNSQANGITHEYLIIFSVPVDIEFTISDINMDTLGPGCYYDQIFLSHTPTLTDTHNINIDNGNLLRPNPQGSGNVTVKYFSEDSIKITHGAGTGCNPGVIYISPIRINGNELSILSNQFKNFNVHVNNSKELLIENAPSSYSLKIVSINGQTVLNKDLSKESSIVNICNIPIGFYVLKFDFENGTSCTKKYYFGK